MQSLKAFNRGKMSKKCLGRIAGYMSCIVALIITILFPSDACTRLSKEYPLIISYYWPVEKGQNDFYKLNMEMPNVIDILSNESHGSRAVRKHWEKKGKILLNRVYPFRYHKNETEIYKYFAENMHQVRGISIDEILGNKLQHKNAKILMNVIKKLRINFPDKIIAVWGSSIWKDKNIPLLEAIRDYADIFIPEFYISEKAARNKGLVMVNDRVRKLDVKVPGILKKTVIGIGLYPKMDNDRNVIFREHVLSQIRHLRTDSFLNKFPGIALYAPVYLSPEDQKWLDLVLMEYFLDSHGSHPAQH
jgi:hypothetical protein